jgi:hypothetical protein
LSRRGGLSGSYERQAGGVPSPAFKAAADAAREYYRTADIPKLK